MSWEIREGDNLTSLRQMPDESVQTCITSPPYWGLRDYGNEGQLGLEPTPEEYTANMVEVFREVRRVLRDDGTLWLNLGDSYAGSPPGNVRGVGETSGLNGADSDKYRATLSAGVGTRRSTVAGKGIKPKDLVGIPWRVAFALQADGWYLRSDIIWAKPNPMPESVTDRPTKAHEYLFLLTKSARYFYDADAVREEHAYDWTANAAAMSKQNAERRARVDEADGGILNVGGRDNQYSNGPNPLGRNKRTVWTVATQPFKGAHFAVFPPKLIEPCVLAGAPEKACGECGAPWERVVERTPMVMKPSKRRAEWQATDKHAATQTGGTMTQAPSSKTTGWQPTCDHNNDAGSSVVLDPFSGSGTTGMVALRHNRSYIGLELNPEYAAMSRDRIRDDAPLLNTGLEAAA